MVPAVLVVPLDGSDFAARALPVARALAWRCAAAIDLVTTRWDGDLDAPTSYVAALAAAAQSGAVRPVVVPDRSPAAAVRLVAGEGPGRVVCMTTHGRGRMRWAVLGSVAETVVRESTAPVLLVGRACELGWADGIRRILVCADGASAAPAVLPEAVEWAKTLELDVVVATVFHPSDPAIASPAVDAIVAGLVAQGLRARSVVLRSGYPAGALADYVDAGAVDLVAMSSHARTGSARFALGSVTMGVVGMARRPVLVARTVRAPARAATA